MEVGAVVGPAPRRSYGGRVVDQDDQYYVGSPYSTGGGGTVLEHRYGAILLGQLLLGDPVPELGDDVVPIEVRFQDAVSSPVDDLIVVGRAPDGTGRWVSIGVRRAPKLTASDVSTADLLKSYLRVVTEHWDEVQVGRWRLALAVASPNPAVQQVGELTVVARSQPDEAAFRHAMARPGRASRAVRGRLDHLDELVGKAATQAKISSPRVGELTWRLLHALWVRELRLEMGDGSDQTAVISRLRTVVPAGDVSGASNLFLALEKLSSDYAPSAARVTEAMVRQRVSGMVIKQERFPRVHRADERNSPLILAEQPSARTPRSEASYRATIREIRSRTGELDGRDAELADIAAFATGAAGYRWLVGDAWAGKTSLLAAATATVLLDGVDVVAYFLSQREADADADRFLAAVVPQLAELLDEDPPAADLHAFRALWERAAATTAAVGRDLLLVVDGLDEDLCPATGPSVACLLPSNVKGRAHVLVSSRPHPELPADVPVGHALVKAKPHFLVPFTGAAELAALARQEIDRLRHRDDLALTVLGLLTAAAGPLSVDDLATLITAAYPPAPIHIDRVRRLVEKDAARSLQRVGPISRGRYGFAHQTLLDQAKADHVLGHQDFRQRIHAWADMWRDAGWPTAGSADASGTPRYLLGDYLTTLIDDPVRRHELAGDVLWSVAAIQAHGVDRVLAALRSVVHPGAAISPARVAYDAIRAQAHHLRDLQAPEAPGLIAGQLRLHALELDEHALAETLRSRRLALPEPSPMPLWTTRRTNTALDLELGRIDGDVKAVAVLPDGRIVTGSGDSVSSRHHGQVLVWDLTQPDAAPVELGRTDRSVNAIAVLPDGRVVTGSAHLLGVSLVQVWNPAQPDAAPVELGRTDRSVNAIAVLPDGRVVTGSGNWGHNYGGGRLLVWDPIERDTSPFQLGSLGDAIVESVDVLPDGRIITRIHYGTSGGEFSKRVLIWDPSQPDSHPLRLDLTSRVDAVAVFPDGRIITCIDSSDNDRRPVLVWDRTRPDTAPVVLGRDGYHTAPAAALPDGRVVTSSSDSVGGCLVLVWDPEQSDIAPQQLGSDDLSVKAVAALPDGRIITGSGASSIRQGGRVLVWDPSRPITTPLQASHDYHSAHAVAVLPDGRIVIGGDDGHDGTVLVHDPAQPETPPLRTPLGSVGKVHAVAVLPDGRIVIGGEPMLVWDPAEPSSTPLQIGPDDHVVFAVAVLPGLRIATEGMDSDTAVGRVFLWDLAEPDPAPLQLGPDCHVNAVAALPSGRVVTCFNRSDQENDWQHDDWDHDGAVLVWDPTHADAIPLELNLAPQVNTVAALPDERIIVITGSRDGGQGRVLVWDPARPEIAPHDLSPEIGEVRMVAVLPDGRVVVHGEDGWIRIWDVQASVVTPTVACVALDLAVGIDNSTGGADLVVLHDYHGALSGWSIP
jgi:WD40 repeat protein